MVILPTTVERENVKFTILSGKSGQVRVNVKVGAEPGKPPVASSVTVRVDGKRVGPIHHPFLGTTTISVYAFVGQTISVTTTNLISTGTIEPKGTPTHEDPPTEEKPGLPSGGIELAPAGPGEFKRDLEVKHYPPAKVRVVSRNGLTELK
jgi:hypothetical protein